MIKVRINHQIKASQLRVITAEGENLGVISTGQALTEARERGLDLIEVSPNAEPPIGKIMDYGKYLYDEKKKVKSRSRVKTSELKTIQIKIGTGEHDLELKAKRVSEWITEGNRVKIDLYLIGRSKFMNFNFLKERLERILKLITVEYKVSHEPTKGPKGLTVIVEKK